MNKYIFEDLGRKFSVASIAKLEDEIEKHDRRIKLARLLVRISNIRKEAKEFWDNMTVQERKDFGKSKDEIENGYQAKMRSIVSYENQADLSFDQMSDFWRAMYLSSVVESLEKRKND